MLFMRPSFQTGWSQLNYGCRWTASVAIWRTRKPKSKNRKPSKEAVCKRWEPFAPDVFQQHLIRGGLPTSSGPPCIEMDSITKLEWQYAHCSSSFEACTLFDGLPQGCQAQFYSCTREHELEEAEMRLHLVRHVSQKCVSNFQVVFSDEKEIFMGSMDTDTRDLREEERVFCRHNFGGGSLIIWAAFSGYGLLVLEFVAKAVKTTRNCYEITYCLISEAF